MPKQFCVHSFPKCISFSPIHMKMRSFLFQDKPFWKIHLRISNKPSTWRMACHLCLAVHMTWQLLLASFCIRWTRSWQTDWPWHIHIRGKRFFFKPSQDFDFIHIFFFSRKTWLHGRTEVREWLYLTLRKTEMRDGKDCYWKFAN